MRRPYRALHKKWPLDTPPFDTKPAASTQDGYSGKRFFLGEPNTRLPE